MKTILKWIIGLVILYAGVNWIADNPKVIKVIRKKMNVAVNDGVEWTKKTTKDMLDTASQELDE